MSRSDEKKALRAELLAAQKEFLDGAMSRIESERILSEVEKDADFLRSGVILGYCSIPGEVETFDFLEKWSRTKTVLVPRVEGDDMTLRLFSPDLLQIGYKGILEPSSQAPSYPFECVEFAIIPGLAFAPCPEGGFHRMGRGKGFYDRAASRLKCPLCAVCFPFRVLESIPTDSWDVKMDKLYY